MGGLRRQRDATRRITPKATMLQFLNFHCTSLHMPAVQACAFLLVYGAIAAYLFLAPRESATGDDAVVADDGDGGSVYSAAYMTK